MDGDGSPRLAVAGLRKRRRVFIGFGAFSELRSGRPAVRRKGSCVQVKMEYGRPEGTNASSDCVAEGRFARRGCGIVRGKVD